MDVVPKRLAVENPINHRPSDPILAADLPAQAQPRGVRARLHQPGPVTDGPRKVDLPAPTVAALVAALDGVNGETITSKEALHRLKLRLAKDHRLPKVPSDADILAALPAEVASRHRNLLRKKATRTLSGVAIVTIQSSPERCPHGTCVFCPGGPDVGSAQSYTGEEPAALRARAHAFDPYAQTASRLAALAATGHDTNKVDLIIQGGTFPARDVTYQRWFVQRSLDAMNDADLGWTSGETRPQDRPGSTDLEAAKRLNESAPARCIGLTVETKPDWWAAEHIDVALDYGTTRVELGIQTTDDTVLKATNRGHDVAESMAATQRAKDAGFKLCDHLMPGLPGSTPDSDIATGHALFHDSAWRPDMLKIYPTLVMPGTPLALQHDAGTYTELGTEEAARVIGEILREVPPYLRVQRVDRDIPTTLIQGGVDKSNIRQLAERYVHDTYGERILDLRALEVGHHRRDTGPHHEVRPDQFESDRLILTDHRYEASGGQERFLAIEDADDGAVFGYLRLRRLADPHRPELRPGDAMIREVKVPGTVVPVGADDETKAQHRGLGTRLCIEAARIAATEWDTERLFVIAGIGVKPYYRKLGFVDDGVYLRAAATPDEATHHGVVPTKHGVPGIERAYASAHDLDEAPRPGRVRQR